MGLVLSKVQPALPDLRGFTNVLGEDRRQLISGIIDPLRKLVLCYLI